VTILDEEMKRRLRTRQKPLPPSTFTWGKRFFQSFRANNLKKLDVAIYFGLRSAISKQLYRFLDKRFYVRPEWVFPLRDLAWGHVGLSRGYTDAKIKEKLRPALGDRQQLLYLRFGRFRFDGDIVLRQGRRPLQPLLDRLHLLGRNADAVGIAYVWGQEGCFASRHVRNRLFFRRFSRRDPSDPENA
jgi:hypothetical protein